VDPGGGGSKSSSTSGSTAPELVGQWSCNDTLETNPVQPWCVSGTCPAPTNASIAEVSPTKITATFSAGTSGTCTLKFTVDGTTATLSPTGQECATGQQQANITYTSGTLILTSPGMITGSFMGVFSGTWNSLAVKGTASLSASCQEQ